MKIFLLKILSILLFLTLFNSGNLMAQLSAYHGIISPYDGNNKLGQTFGDIAFTASNFLSDIQTNPASLVFFKHPQLNLSLHQNIITTKIDYEFNRNATSQFTKYSFFPGLISASVPFKMLNHDVVFAASVNKISSPEYEIWGSENNEVTFKTRHNRDGHVGYTTLGVSSQPFDNLSIGISWTKWFGHWQWRDEFGSGDFYGEGKFNYYGNNIAIGVSKKFKKSQLSVVIHSPFTLMKADRVRFKTFDLEQIHNIKQRFNGAVRVGLSYQLLPQLKLGLGYRFQNSFEIQNEAVEFMEVLTDRYKKSQQLSIVGEYTLKIKTLRLPFFLAYQANWMSEIPNNISGYQIVVNDDGKLLNNNIAMGFNLPYKSMNLFFMSQLNLSSIKLFNQIMPPIS